MPGRVINGYSPVLPHDFKKYCLLFHSLEVYFMYRYNNNHYSPLFPWPLLLTEIFKIKCLQSHSVSTCSISLSCSTTENTELSLQSCPYRAVLTELSLQSCPYRAVLTELSLAVVLSCPLKNVTSLLTAPQGTVINVLTWLWRFHPGDEVHFSRENLAPRLYSVLLVVLVLIVFKILRHRMEII